jgi:cytochrome c553
MADEKEDNQDLADWRSNPETQKQLKAWKLGMRNDTEALVGAAQTSTDPTIARLGASIAQQRLFVKLLGGTP